ncbi:type I restriction-modification system subunit M [Paenibacillus ehimensis]|uniref:type I restriction-modification system subunit M n=1 Tax=Paenibacillus ehimensis TaxID=79264 RepID=UPI002DBA6784|nr:type I restriction-modification system subunit M [Paenibacillus ehimensis]MEC0209860.1 type I restriction-modification system subunit M [Paenibacillus ehimensis]
MAVKKSELYSSLWASCDKLRGGMDASQYKDYILTLLFVKYVSDRFKGVAYADIEVPEGGSFDDMVALIGNKNIGEEMDKVIAKLAEANGLRGVIDNAHFNDETKLGKGQEMVDKLSGLISIFRRPELNFSSNRADGDDIIGDAYEYLMRNFATESGKSKGQFYTPAEVSRILAKVIGIDRATKRDTSVYDPACGSGSLLIRAADEAPFEVAIYGQEKDIATAGLAKMNLVLHNKASGEIAGNYSTFSDPQFFEDDEEKTTLRRFDFVVANPPFSTKNWTDGLKEYGRFDGYGDRPPEKNGDFAWLLHILKSLKRNGKAAVILPHGVLFRGNAEAKIRQSIVDKGYIKGIIGLPANLFYGTGIPACIIVIDKEGADERDGIFMIDASHDYIKDGNKNRLRERDIYKIVTTFRQWIEEPKYSRFVPIEEIRDKNGYNLNISRYIDSSIPEDLQNIEAHLKGGIPAHDVDNMERYWSIFGDLKSVLFAPLREGFYQPIVKKDDVRHTIYSHAEFSQYADRIDNAFEKWQSRVNDKLCNIDANTKVKELIVELAEAILEEFEDITLVDKYDVYQVLLAYWQDVMADDVFIVSQDGYTAARETENIMGVYTSGKKKGEEKVIGWEGKLIPRSIIVEAFFRAEQKAIDEIETLVTEAQSELDEMIEGAEDDSIINTVLKDNGSLDMTALKAALKNKTLGKDDREVLQALSDKKTMIDEQGKALKKLKEVLEQKTKEQYGKLTDEEILDLLVNRKWYHTIFEGIDALYTSISHSIANRVTELTERYEKTLPIIQEEVAEYEMKVKSHLERMGFVW